MSEDSRQIAERVNCTCNSDVLGRCIVHGNAAPVGLVHCGLCGGAGHRMVIWGGRSGMRVCCDCEGSGLISQASN